MTRLNRNSRHKTSLKTDGSTVNSPLAGVPARLPVKLGRSACHPVPFYLQSRMIRFLVSEGIRVGWCDHIARIVFLFVANCEFPSVTLITNAQPAKRHMAPSHFQSSHRRTTSIHHPHMNSHPRRPHIPNAHKTNTSIQCTLIQIELHSRLKARHNFN